MVSLRILLTVLFLIASVEVWFLRTGYIFTLLASQLSCFGLLYLGNCLKLGRIKYLLLNIDNRLFGLINYLTSWLDFITFPFIYRLRMLIN